MSALVYRYLLEKTRARLDAPVHADVHRLARVFEAALQIDALLLFERFVHDDRVLAGGVLDHHGAHERMATLGQSHEACELSGGHLRECLPEIALQIRHDPRGTSRDD